MDVIDGIRKGTAEHIDLAPTKVDEWSPEAWRLVGDAKKRLLAEGSELAVPATVVQ